MNSGRKNKKIRGFSEMPEGKLLEALILLSKSGARFLIVGGVAANLHGLSRSTKDIDVLIPKDLKNTEKILNALSELTWGIAKEITAEEVISKPFTIIGDLPRVDLLLNAGKLKFEEAIKNKETTTIGNVSIPFVSLEDLIHSKKTGRPHDDFIIKEIRKLKKL